MEQSIFVLTLMEEGVLMLMSRYIVFFFKLVLTEDVILSDKGFLGKGTELEGSKTVLVIPPSLDGRA